MYTLIYFYIYIIYICVCVIINYIRKPASELGSRPIRATDETGRGRCHLFKRV